ncbi:MAG TPA: hypothetical protein VN704_11210 [Verrucomicrobiae bacterium]|nr:hypothetical protein [Verrucomicrobiae bacterium]
MSNNNNLNINNNKTNSKKKPFDPTIGDAVKEAIETIPISKITLNNSIIEKYCNKI